MKLAIVGTGMIVELTGPHLADWGWDVVAICGTPSTTEQVEQFCSELGGLPFSDYDEMLASGIEADAVYVATPNFLHKEMTLKALAAGYNVICEKPFAANADEVAEMVEAAKRAGLFLFEAIMPMYLPNYETLRDLLPRVGQVQVVSCNYSQYSSRYDAFKAGQILPAFDPAKAGGALMDLGLYNLYWICGLFGEPEHVSYAANIERGIDVSGVALLDYGTFKAVSVAAKNCAAPIMNVIEGTEGYLMQRTPANVCGPVTLCLNDGTTETFDANPDTPWESEFRAFADHIASGDTVACYQALDRSLLVSSVQTTARLSAGVRFPMDER